MNRLGPFLRLVPVVPVLFGVAGGVVAAEDTRGAAFKIQIGGHVLSQANGIGLSWAPDVEEDDGGIVGALTFLGRERSRFPYGVCLELDGNGVEVGPPVGIAGTQLFGIATIRLTGLIEFRLHKPTAVKPGKPQPYASLGAGWSFHSAGSKISWLGSTPPAGTPLSLDLDGSPALRAALGFNHVTRGTAFNLECGWKWDTGDYRVLVQGEPARSGSYDLSGMFVLFGVTLRG